MGNTIDMLSDNANASDNESVHSDPADPSSDQNPTNKEDPAPRRKQNTTEPKFTKKATKPAAKTSEKDLAKDDASIESRGFHRHGGVLWYNAELVMLGMALVLYDTHAEVVKCFPHGDPSAVASCIQRATNERNKGWIMPKEADRNRMLATLRTLRWLRVSHKWAGDEQDIDEEVGDEEGDQDEELV